MDVHMDVIGRVASGTKTEQLPRDLLLGPYLKARSLPAVRDDREMGFGMTVLIVIR